MDSTTKRKIELAGRSFEIPCLPFAKNRKIIPAVSFALREINEQKDKPTSVTAVDNTYLAVFEAISYVDPKVTREDFDKWEIFWPDLMAAMMIVALQTGVLVQSKDKAGASGEAEAGPT